VMRLVKKVADVELNGDITATDLVGLITGATTAPGGAGDGRRI
jgi:hypothetical protein